MDETNFDSIIDYLLDNSISITLSKDSKGVRWYDLNTQMKSDLKVSYQCGELCYEGRYNIKGTCPNLTDLLWQLKECMCGRDFANPEMIRLLVKNGMLTVNTTTTTTYS